MGASYLKSHAGLPMEELENNAAYIQGWLKRLKDDKKFIIYASSKAQRAADFILDVKVKEKELELIEDAHEIVDKSMEREKELKSLRIKKQQIEKGLER